MIAVILPHWMALLEISIKPGNMNASSATHAQPLATSGL
jgi:hypothetical protein